MRQDQIVTVFDGQAEGYDAQGERVADLRHALFQLVGTAFGGLQPNARVLCVGVGTGLELAYLARAFPGWRFTAVEPSGPMLDVCRQRADQEGFASRCVFHQGFLDSLPADHAHDAATCFLVSQFILDREERSAFFRAIGERLRPGGLLASSDLASGGDPGGFDALLRLWVTQMAGEAVTAERLDHARAAYSTSVAVLPPSDVADIIESGGFESSVQFFQAGLLHAWLSRRPDRTESARDVEIAAAIQERGAE